MKTRICVALLIALIVHSCKKDSDTTDSSTSQALRCKQDKIYTWNIYNKGDTSSTRLDSFAWRGNTSYQYGVSFGKTYLWEIIEYDECGAPLSRKRYSTAFSQPFLSAYYSYYSCSPYPKLKGSVTYYNPPQPLSFMDKDSIVWHDDSALTYRGDFPYPFIITVYNTYGKALSAMYYNSDGSMAYGYTYTYIDCDVWCKPLAEYAISSSGGSEVRWTATWNGNTQTKKDGFGTLMEINTYDEHGNIIQALSYNDGELGSIKQYSYKNCR